MIEHRKITVGDTSVKQVHIANNLPFALIAGPCQIESRDHVMMMAEKLKETCESLNIPLIFKASYDKANRTSLGGQRGIGMENGLKIFEEIRQQFQVPVITDIHTAEQCAPVAEVVDILQIPAFLCRQTDLLIAAAKTGKPLNVKKGQFLAPWDMKNVANKISDSGNDNILLCERGVTFGYNTLINDMRALPVMRATGYPVIMDATHSVQQPGGAGGSTSGERKFVETIARAAIAVGVAGVFLETHDDPDNAASDGPNMVYLKDMAQLLARLNAFDQISKANPNDVI